MFTASQLLDKINHHISEIQFTRTPKGLYEPIEADTSCVNVDGI